MCHMSRLTCHVSQVHFLFCFVFSMWWSLSGEGLLSTGPTPSSFMHIYVFSYQKSYFNSASECIAGGTDRRCKFKHFLAFFEIFFCQLCSANFLNLQSWSARTSTLTKFAKKLIQWEKSMHIVLGLFWHPSLSQTNILSLDLIIFSFDFKTKFLLLEILFCRDIPTCFLQKLLQLPREALPTAPRRDCAMFALLTGVVLVLLLCHTPKTALNLYESYHMLRYHESPETMLG